MPPLEEFGVIDRPEGAEVVLEAHETLVQAQVGADGVLRERKKNILYTKEKLCLCFYLSVFKNEGGGSSVRASTGVTSRHPGSSRHNQWMVGTLVRIWSTNLQPPRTR